MKQRIISLNMSVEAVRNLEHGKTQHRLLIKPQPGNQAVKGPYYVMDCGKPMVSTYKVGDIIYVREPWDVVNEEPDETKAEYLYYADYPDPGHQPIKRCHSVWMPASSMRKLAVRHWLEVTNIYPQKLITITNEEIKREGHKNKFYLINYWNEWVLRNCKELIKMKRLLTYGWDTNPWVWVIEFKEIEKPSNVDYRKRKVYKKCE